MGKALPKVLSLYDGFFVGGSRIVHTDIISHLQAEELFSSKVLSLSNKVKREYTTQKAHQTASWKLLEKTGVEVTALNRTPEEPFTDEQLSQIQNTLNEADVILSLKEQPLTALQNLDISKPLLVALHRSDPEHQGEGVEELISLAHEGVLTKAISCAYSAKNSYSATGLPEELIEVVENGIDLNRFRVSHYRRNKLRKEWAVDKNTPAIMIAARFDKMKNIPLFMESAGHFLKAYPEAIFVTCGAGMTRENPAFEELVKTFIPKNRQEQVKGLGISRTEKLYPAADIVALTSAFGEAAPLCLLEAIACGAIPVTTDVGDSKLIVKRSELVTSQDPKMIAETWTKVWEEKTFWKNYSLSRRPEVSDKHMITRYGEIIKNVL